MKYEVYDDKSGQARWRLKAGNGQIVASSGEPFASVSSATNAATNFRDKCATWRYEVYETPQAWSWKAVSPANGQTVGTAGETFPSQSNAKRAADNVQENGGEGEIVRA